MDGCTLDLHGLVWYVGLVAAFLAEIAVRVPGVGFSSGLITTTILAVAGGAFLIHTRDRRLLATSLPNQLNIPTLLYEERCRPELLPVPPP